MNNRRLPISSMYDSGESEDDDEFIPVSYCPKCEKYDIKTLLGPRIYGLNEPQASDHDLWLQCPKCGHLIARVHAKQEGQIAPFIEPPKTIHDSLRPVMTPIHERSNKVKAVKENMKPIGSDREDVIKKDLDLQQMLAKGKQLINYTDSNTQ